MKALIVTADDFGVSLPVNEAVETAHTKGILSAASLMTGAPAFEDAVARARRLPSLGVGIHLTMVDGRPVLPPDQVPGLVGTDGRFLNDPVRFGMALYFSPSLRRQVEAETLRHSAASSVVGLLDSTKNCNYASAGTLACISKGARCASGTNCVLDYANYLTLPQTVYYQLTGIILMLNIGRNRRRTDVFYGISVVASQDQRDTGKKGNCRSNGRTLFFLAKDHRGLGRDSARNGPRDFNQDARL